MPHAPGTLEAEQRFRFADTSAMPPKTPGLTVASPRNVPMQNRSRARGASALDSAIGMSADKSCQDPPDANGTVPVTR